MSVICTVAVKVESKFAAFAFSVVVVVVVKCRAGIGCECLPGTNAGICLRVATFRIWPYTPAIVSLDGTNFD